MYTKRHQNVEKKRESFFIEHFLCSVSTVGSSDGHLLKVGDPDWHDSFTLGSGRKVAAIFRVGREFSFGDDLTSVIVQTMDDRTLSLFVIESNRRLGRLREISLGLEGILKSVNDGPGRAEVPVGRLHLGDAQEGSFRLEMILKWGHNVAPAGREGLVLGLGLRFCRLGSHGQAEAGRAAIGGARLAAMAKKLHLSQSFSLSSDEKT